jgi:TonB family protein
MTLVWPKWQNEVLNGVYPLRRLLSGGDHSAVFLSEFKAPHIAAVAIKIVPAERVTLAQLSYWRTAAGLTHPHLIRLLDTGLCQLEGRQFLFVVMEFAEQTLAQVLLQRALTADEVQEMLSPTLSALGFLHGKNLVQGQLKPANFLVVKDQLKLASDTVRPAGEPRAGTAESSPYDPPEAEGGRLFPAGDIWALGITLVEALTQRLPVRPDGSETASLPTTLPPTLVDTVQRCLSHDPASRPTATDLEAPFKHVTPTAEASVPAPPATVVSTAPATATVVSIPQAVVREAPQRAAPPVEAPRPRSLLPAIAAILVLLIVVWGGTRLFSGSQNPEMPLSARPSEKSTEPKPAPSRPVTGPSDQPALPLTNASPVLHEQIPIVPRSALATIHGHIKVAVRVTVDASGKVIDTRMETLGPSRYFARLAREAAREWKFSPADNQDSREWRLRFEFTRGGVTGQASRKK